MRTTNLDFTTIYPTNFDKQKMHLTMNVFSERVLVKLSKNGRLKTACMSNDYDWKQILGKNC